MNWVIEIKTLSWVQLAAIRMCSWFHCDGNIEFSVLFKETFVHLFTLMRLGRVLKHFSEEFQSHYNKEILLCGMGFLFVAPLPQYEILQLKYLFWENNKI